MDRHKWGIEVKIALLQKGLNQYDLAKEFKVARPYVNEVINNRRGRPQRELVRKISDYLGIEYPEERGKNDS